MSKIIVYIAPPAYLEQWLRHEFWDAEANCVRFPRGSAPAVVLMTSLRSTPTGYFADNSEGSLPIAVPTIKGINPSDLCYLPDTGKTAVVSTCKRVFQANLYNELHLLFAHDVQITDIIYDFMDRHGIDCNERNWETIRQMYARMRKKNLTAKVKLR